jgi:hypothetical protein
MISTHLAGFDKQQHIIVDMAYNNALQKRDISGECETHHLTAKGIGVHLYCGISARRLYQ